MELQMCWRHVLYDSIEENERMTFFLSSYLFVRHNHVQNIALSKRGRPSCRT